MTDAPHPKREDANSQEPKPITPKGEESFFIGWSSDVPVLDRRFLLGASVSLLGLGATAAAGLASQQNRAGPGTWDQADTRDFVGQLFVDPYPSLRILAEQELDGSVRRVYDAPRPALLGCLGKCGVRPRLEGMIAGGNDIVAIRGTLIERGRHAMVSVIDGVGWVRAVADPAALGVSAEPQPWGVPAPEALGEATLSGEILDSKCWFGAMRPSEGKAHKACAALCIQSGLPPSFYAKDRAGRVHVFLLTSASGGPLHEEVASLAADPVRAPGRLVKRDFVEFRVDPSAIQRV